MRHVVILTHPNDEFSKRGYMLAGVAQQWREMGTRVSVVDDPAQRIDADMAILHTDLTVVPEEYMKFMERYPLAMNAGVSDISKRKISANIVKQGDGYDGAVIVKTNLNCGGLAEGEIKQKSSSFFEKYIRAIRRRLHWSMRAEMSFWDYPIFDSVKQVPRAVWLNPDLVVERFLPEIRDGLYCMRSWSFLGDASENSVMYSKQAIIKSPVAVHIEQTLDIPEEIRQLRRDFGFDFGKFDYGICEGKPVLYDANRTPVCLPKPENVPTFKLLARGLDSFPKRFRAAG